MDGKDLAIGTLSVTAAVLFVGLVLVQTQTPRAMAVGQIDRGGDYVMLTGQVNPDDEALYVLDTAIPRLNLYRFDINVGLLSLDDQFNFGRPPVRVRPPRRRR